MFVKYPSINQFRHISAAVSNSAEWTNTYDADGNPVYDKSRRKPALEFIGHVKLHGTNAGVTYDAVTDEVYAQSRSRIITPESDNAGFAVFVHKNKDLFRNWLRNWCKAEHNSRATLFGEWAGGSIQKGVGINGVEKFFAVFEIGTTFPDEESEGGEKTNYWPAPIHMKNEDARIFHVSQFGFYKKVIDFQDPQRYINYLAGITDEVEKECPAAKFFGVENGTGEGVVWFVTDSLGLIKYRFKVKGEKHSSSKVKTLATVDPEKLDSIDKFVEYAVTENRLEQGAAEVKRDHGDLDIKKVGLFIKWISQDVIKEEIDTLAASNLTMKDVGSKISQKAREWYFSKFV